jgi:hypothetical protein
MGYLRNVAEVDPNDEPANRASQLAVPITGIKIACPRLLKRFHLECPTCRTVVMLL